MAASMKFEASRKAAFAEEIPPILTFIGSPVNVQVTAKWGWAAVPTDVKNACRRLAQMRYKSKNAPFGVAGVGDMGAIHIKAEPILSKN